MNETLENIIKKYNPLDFIEQKINGMALLDKYILKQVIGMFIMGVCVFTTIIFASDTFINLIKQISEFGIPFKVAIMMIVLNLPAILVMTIPMGVLLATVMTLNKLSLSSEITVMRACGMSLSRIAKPVFAFAIAMCIFGFILNEAVVPVTTKQSKDLALWAFGQKHIPNGKQNFTFKEVSHDGGLKRMFYVGYCEKDTLHNISVIDTSKENVVQVIQAKEGETSPAGWVFQKGAMYVIDVEGKVLNTSLFEDATVKFGMDLSRQMNRDVAQERNFVKLIKYLKVANLDKELRQATIIDLFDKIAMPVTTIVFVLVGVPLAITPPRVRYNRGFLFSILIIFVYYLVRALSISFGMTGTLNPFFAAWMPNIVLAVLGSFIYYKKVYTIS